MPVEDLSLYPITPVLVDQDRLDKLVFGICALTGFAGDLSGFDFDDMAWNHTTHQAEYELAEAHYYSVLAFVPDNPIVQAIIEVINTSSAQAGAITFDDI